MGDGRNPANLDKTGPVDITIDCDQNERSLFSFLCSYEPFGLRAFSNNSITGTSRPYQLADFYDYIRANFGHRLEVASYRTHWSVIESKIEAHPADNALEVRILKTVGVLNLLHADDLRPVGEAVCWAVAGHSEQDRRQVSRLLKLRGSKDATFTSVARPAVIHSGRIRASISTPA